MSKNIPFSLPLTYEADPHRPGCGYVYEAGDTLMLYFTEDHARYLIRAVNNFEKMRDALRPFAAYARLDECDSFESHIACVLIGDLNHAAAVLKEIEDD